MCFFEHSTTHMPRSTVRAAIIDTAIKAYERLRPLAVILTVLMTWTTGIAAAQGDQSLAYIAQVMGLISDQDEKLVNEALNDWDAIDGFEVSCAAHRVKLSAHHPVSEGELTERLAGTGTALLWLAEVQADGSLAGPSYVAHAFPVYVDTGDPVGDNARYDMDKAAWLAAHPGWVDANTRPIEHGGAQPEIEK